MMLAVPVVAASRKYLRSRPNLDLPPLHAARVLVQLRERLQLMHHSLRTEDTYEYGVEGIHPHPSPTAPCRDGLAGGHPAQHRPAHEKCPLSSPSFRHAVGKKLLQGNRLG